MTNDPTGRLAEMVMHAYDGDLALVRDWLMSIGGRDLIEGSDGDWSLTGPSGVRIGMAPGLDPIAYAAQIGFAVAGPFWPQVFPGLLPEVQRRWKSMSSRRG